MMTPMTAETAFFTKIFRVFMQPPDFTNLNNLNFHLRDKNKKIKKEDVG
jgi:hypothetical protein